MLFMKTKSADVNMDVHPAFQAAAPILIALWAQFRLDPIVTAGKEEGHSARSAHHDGRALDLRIWYIVDDVALGRGIATALNMLAPNWKWYVVLESDHIHLEVCEPADAPNIKGWKAGKYFYQEKKA